jgi:hypothetical protein
MSSLRNLPVARQKLPGPYDANLYVIKLMSIFVNMDKEVGRLSKSGLNNLKTVAEH